MVHPECFYTKLDEEWVESLEKYERKKEHEPNVVNWEKLANPVHSDSSQRVSTCGDKDATFLQV